LLSPRQRQCLTLAAQGLTWRQVAQKLKIATGTVRNYLLIARARLGARNTTHAVALAIAREEIKLESIIQEDDEDEITRC
jgi:DNA-binding CsgD family transcriptional regulator